MSKRDQHMELTTPGLGGDEEIYKCTDCGAETFPEEGFNGEPDKHLCTPDCKMDHGGKTAGNSNRYREGIARMFPNHPFADI